MKKYERPVVLVNEELAEGVYAASGYNGGDCYVITAEIKQTPELGRENYTIQCDADHITTHHGTSQLMTISFNQPVTYVWSNGSLDSGDNTNCLKIVYNYHNNGYETGIGLGELFVKSEEGLAITGVVLGCNETCEHNDL